MIYGRLSTPTKGRTNLHSINRELQLIHKSSFIPSFTFHCTQREGKLRVTKGEKREGSSWEALASWQPWRWIFSISSMLSLSSSPPFVFYFLLVFPFLSFTLFFYWELYCLHEYSGFISWRFEFQVWFMIHVLIHYAYQLYACLDDWSPLELVY